MNAKKIRSWDGTHVWIPEKIYNLKDKEKIAKQIKRAVEEEKRTEAIGRALSWSDIIDIPENTILFDEMDKVLQVDTDHGSNPTRAEHSAGNSIFA